MARDEPQINIRVPAALRDKLVAAAEGTGRSLTAEIVQRLEGSFESQAEIVQLRVQATQERAAMQAHNAALRDHIAALESARVEQVRRTIPGVSKTTADAIAAVHEMQEAGERFRRAVKYLERFAPRELHDAFKSDKSILELEFSLGKKEVPRSSPKREAQAQGTGKPKPRTRKR